MLQETPQHFRSICAGEIGQSACPSPEAKTTLIHGLTAGTRSSLISFMLQNDRSIDCN
jgi:hypothetical protein